MRNTHGFTLVELAIVLVILGLLVGGVLAGQSLIAAAQMRSQITQIEQYKQVIFQFRDKYFWIPGDLDASIATRLGFNARDGSNGSGDKDGTLEGHDGFTTKVSGGEATLFWSDLADAGLIDGTFDTASGTAPPGSAVTSGYEAYYPAADIGKGHVIAWGGSKGAGNTFVRDGALSLAVQDVDGIRTDGYLLNTLTSIESAVFTVEQAWNIDTKMDDGLPLRGNVVTQIVVHSVAPIYTDISRMDDENTVATSATTNNCIDNGNTGGAEHEYTLSNSSTLNCALSFRIQ